MVYEFVCMDCDRMVEVKATVSEYEKGLKLTCPHCGSEEMVRVFSGITIALKGGVNFGGCGPTAGPGCCG